MKKLYKLNIDNEMTLNKNILNFLDPDYIYLPIDDFSFLEEKEYIYKNQNIFEKDNIDYNSSISGSLETLSKITINNVGYNAIVLKNDFKEKEIKYKINDTTEYKGLIELLNKNILLKNIDNEQAENIVINGIEDEPYTYTESYILRKNIDIIFDTTEKLNQIYKSKKNYITIKNTDIDNVDKYLSSIGAYPSLNIVVLDNLYLLGKNEFLLEKIKLQNKKTIVLKPSEILEIRNYLKYGTNKSEKYITIVNMIDKKIFIINTKKYVKIIDILNKFKLNKNATYIKNGLMSGIKINPETEVIDESFNSLYIVEDCNNPELDCINCGKCSAVCPLNNNPKELIFKKNEKCIDCALCSYFCPSNINLRSRLRGEENE